jgi:hypothetical protein
MVADSLRPATTTETSGWPSLGSTGGLGRTAEGFAIYTSHTMSVGSNRYRALPNAQGAASSNSGKAVENRRFDIGSKVEKK